METRKDLKGKVIVQVWLPVEDVVWIDQQKLAGMSSSRAGVLSKLINNAKVVE